MLLALGQGIVGLIVYLESTRTRRIDQKLFSGISVLLVMWTLSVGFLYDIDNRANLQNIEQFRLVNQLAFFLALLILQSLLVFTQYYPIKRRFSNLTKALLTCGILLLMLAPTSLIAGRLDIVGGSLVYDYGRGIFVVAAFALAVLFTIFADNRQRIRKTSDTKVRQQVMVLQRGMVLSIIHIIFFIVVCPTIFGQIPILYALGYAGPYYLIGFTTYGLLQLGLFDIRRIVARTLVYIVTILVLSAIYGFLVFGIVYFFFEERLSLTFQVFLAITTGIASLSFQGIKRFFDKKTSRIFYQDAYDSEELFDEYNRTLVSTIDLDILLKRVAMVISSHLKSEYCIIGVKEKGRVGYRIGGTHESHFLSKDIEQLGAAASRVHYPIINVEALQSSMYPLRDVMYKYNVALLVRLTSRHHPVQEGMGYLALGPKKSGNPYTTQDVKVVEALSNELIIALQNALRFEEIERFNETLQQKVEDATLKLRESNKKLKQLNDSKDDFIGMTSHQLRTPLTSIKGYISLVIDGDAGRINAKQKELLQQAFNSSQKMVYLVSDLLNVSRLKTGKFVIERTPVNLAKMIADEMDQLKAEAEGRGLELTYEAPKDFPTLPLDETKTRQVIMNFLDNAIYYTPSGGHIKAELKDLPTSIEFQVVDDGIGVPKGERHQLFTKFFRARNAQRARPDGTGLGLYMARKVVTVQGGALIFSSEEGKGSTFGFIFPKDLPTESVALPAQTRD